MEAGILAAIAGHRSAPLDAAASALSLLGRAGGIWLALAALRAFAGRREAMAAWQAVLSVLVASMLTDAVLKPVVHRPRPPAPLAAAFAAQPGSDSFPSGHAATAVAGAWALGAAWPGARAALVGLAALVALSRVYLGVHYPSDVLAGAVVGWLAAWFALGGTVWRWRAKEPGA